MDWTGPNGTDRIMIRSDDYQNWKKERHFFKATSKSKQIMVNLVNLCALLAILLKEKFKINTKRDLYIYIYVYK